MVTLAWKHTFFAYKLNFDFLLEKPVKNDQIFLFRISTPNIKLLLSLEKWVIDASFIWVCRSVSELFDLKVLILTWGTLFEKNQEKSILSLSLQTYKINSVWPLE